MHILYLHQYFATRKGRTGTRSYEFSRHLIGKGHRVTMITSGLGNDEFPVPKDKDYVELEAEGIRVVPIAAAYNNPQIGTATSGWRRMLKFYQFARLAARVGKKLPRPDGQPRRRLDVSKAKECFGFEAKTTFDEGLKATIDWYTANRRGI